MDTFKELGDLLNNVRKEMLKIINEKGHFLSDSKREIIEDMFTHTMIENYYERRRIKEKIDFNNTQVYVMKEYIEELQDLIEKFKKIINIHINSRIILKYVKKYFEIRASIKSFWEDIIYVEGSINNNNFIRCKLCYNIATCQDEQTGKPFCNSKCGNIYFYIYK